MSLRVSECVSCFGWGLCLKPLRSAEVQETRQCSWGRANSSSADAYLILPRQLQGEKVTFLIGHLLYLFHAGNSPLSIRIVAVPIAETDMKRAVLYSQGDIVAWRSVLRSSVRRQLHMCEILSILSVGRPLSHFFLSGNALI